MLKTVFVDDFKRETDRLVREFAAPEHVDKDRWLDTTALALTPSGKPTALLLKRCIDLEVCKNAYTIGMTMEESLETRPSAVGSKAVPRIKKSGRLGNYTVTPDSVLAVLERDHARQGLLGATAGTRARPAHVTELTEKRPELLDQLRPLIEAVDQLYRKYLPTSRAVQRAEVRKAPHLRLWHTAFSSAYFAKQLRCAYHRDSENLPGVMTALMPLGDFT